MKVSSQQPPKNSSETVLSDLAAQLAATAMQEKLGISKGAQGVSHEEHNSMKQMIGTLLAERDTEAARVSLLPSDPLLPFVTWKPRRRIRAPGTPTQNHPPTLYCAPRPKRLQYKHKRTNHA